MPAASHSSDTPNQAAVEAPAVLALVRQAQAGNRDAFDELVFLYRDQVYAAAWQLTRNTDDALDVTQEVFLRAYRALSSFKGKFSTWLHRIVLNTSVDYVRRERRHRRNVSETEFEQGEEGQPGGTPSSDAACHPEQRERIYAAELQRRVNLALADLSGRQREVFLLRYVQDLNLKEIAEAIRCSEGAVKRHLHRAQLRLKELLEDLKLR